MFYSIVCSILGFFLRIFFRINVHGELKQEENGRYLVVSNHSNLLDPIVLGIVLKPQLHFMAKQELFENKILAKIIYGLNGFPVNRSGNDIVALKKAVKLLRDGNVVGIFIEGTRVKEYNPDNAKAGPILIANMGKATIIPVMIDSTYKLFSNIDVYIKEPYKVEIEKGSGDDGYQDKAKEVLDIIYNG